jgi:hypothetical protein
MATSPTLETTLMHNKPGSILLLAGVVVWTTAAEPAQAAIKLITLPPRQRVEIQLDNPNLTLVEEERVVPLARGVNDVVFAWANANIDKDSIQFRCLTDPEAIKVLSVSYPPGESSLTWQVSSPDAGPARVRISYVIGGLVKSWAYRATASPDEKQLTLWLYNQLHNRSNEEFGVAGMWAGFGKPLESPVRINETKRLLFDKTVSVPVDKVYTADLAKHGYLDPGKRQLRVPMHYRIKNDEAGKLGAYPLPFGKARIFQDDGRGTTAFIGEDWLAFTPREDEVELYLGVAKDIVVKRTIDRSERVRVLGNLAHYDVEVKYEIENFKDTPVVLDIAELMPALRNEIVGNTARQVDWELTDGGTLKEPDPKKTDADRLVFHVPLPPRGDDDKAAKLTHTLHLRIRNEWTGR